MNILTSRASCGFFGDKTNRMSGCAATMALVDHMGSQFLDIVQPSFTRSTPSFVENAILDLLDLPLRHRPLRTDVDPSPMCDARNLNDRISKEQGKLMKSLDTDLMAALGDKVL